MFSTAFMLTKVFLKIFLRDRQAIFFIVFFPIVLMLAFHYGSDRRPGPMEVGIVNHSSGEFAQRFITALDENPLFIVVEGNEEELRVAMSEREMAVTLVIPEEFQNSATGTEVKLLVDSAQGGQVAEVVPNLQKAIVDIERQIRNVEPLITMNMDDVQGRLLRYIDFLLPGILAFTLMQNGIAGSGFNIVEFRRKGILKRLFVTPIEPKDFILGIVNARLLLCLLQSALMLLIAIFIADVTIAGSITSLFLIVILGTVIFLCIGFFLGSVAKTQQSIQGIANLVIFPQMLLSGMFYPIESLPALLQPIAAVLPLSYIIGALREISTNGLSLLEIMPNLLGIFVWLVIGFVVSTRYFVWREVAN